jgi:hypothetical protein
MPVKHEMPSVSPPEFTTLTHNNPLVARFFRWPMVMLLMMEGNGSCFASKPAHISGHLPHGCHPVTFHGYLAVGSRDVGLMYTTDDLATFLHGRRL